MTTISIEPRPTWTLLRTVLLCLGLLLMTAAAWAQPAPAQYTLRIYLSGATSPLTTQTYPASVAACNQTVPPVLADPVRIPVGTKFRLTWEDPTNAGRACILDTATLTSPLFALPTAFGPHDITIEAVAGTEASGESNRAPFRVTPAPIRGVRVFLVTGN